MLFEEERKRSIVQFVEQRTRASVQELSLQLGVSESTIRRDLKELEEARLLKRTHGGAVSLQSVNFEAAFPDKADRLLDEKQRIAAKAVQMIQEGDAILLDGGTTTLQIAKALKTFSNLKVITNSIMALNELRDCRNIEVSITGGMLRPDTMAFVGPMTERSLEMVRVDKTFLGTNGLDLQEGITTPNMLEAATKRKMIAVAKQSILLADHSKIGQVSFCKVADLHEIDHCILDSAVQGNFIRGLEAMDVGFTVV
ncbi:MULTISPECIES: DeoR/GlpR family DNA-binding transcription regulator [unclassified Paenibacillus]|uniref:DeoR/GlpR family DNA-binding transcription regulator n=1 Tax=unclassified Paenibacillus TaxID=185978 RepID=UPI002405828B|nr:MULTISPECIES: DeoR/GlpR family DNA-binding transcription regulator [unclassified Paenibacillus]MDF9840569.1 DeoR family fructose operon transcriptional repressor [Paenibacillus sp. PastF-2]MDF9847151.1 DeoR family fructose operon transcriptional repressor [Paenibacillus sp. PastM-2]MDF9853723.1 DeoR family fructose operon transcriptional repressor [Paenibacillus sp. PastF-1]MDH6478791.1 DeoR family fructose operon transcriptional repressor [Paenibacillus sp. PastH-2]MDH6506523.1 DeoR family